ncbi:GNAT family N-acetyltransferase [Candidatus Poriferisodalis sp.]|uniref:GNAT family N-acetyltransferase n=1 Tax=Candidatus Poriferisodalis sp. TaxID=3101277 RepID=UPI003B51A1B6
MEIVTVDRDRAAQLTDEVVELAYATGPSTYDYQFGPRAAFDRLVGDSWLAEGTLYAFDETRLAIDGDDLLGIEIGFSGPEFDRRKKTLRPLWQPILDDGVFTPAEFAELGRRSYLASYLNVVIPSSAYYVHALSVRPDRHGQGIGAALMKDAIERATDEGYRAVHLDVLSDNPAVKFYEAFGFEALAQTIAPIPHSHGVPMEQRMALDLR